MDNQWNSLVQCPQATDDGHHMVSKLGSSVEVPVPHADIAGQSRADSYPDDLETVGFKHFNPMWTFSTTAVYQNWEPMTFGMAPWHLVD